MEKIDLDNVYFHGIQPPCDETGFTTSSELKILESILRQGAILSRAKQQEVGIESILNANFNRNGANNISICERLGSEYAESDAFWAWVKNNLSVIISKEMPESKFVEQYAGCDGELQIKDSISTNYFVGIGIPCGNETCRQIFKEMSWYCSNKEALKNCIEEYCSRYITPVRTLLKKYGLDIKLYDVIEGEEILPIDEYVEELFVGEDSQEESL